MENITIEKIKIAFQKYQAHIYFDKNDLHSRNQLSQWIKRYNYSDQGFNHIKEVLENNALSEEYIDKIDLRVLPKKVGPNETKVEDSNFYTNENLIDNSHIKSIQVFIDLPIELHIINILWIMEYGVIIDSGLLPINYGNRLYLNENKQLSCRRSLFKAYQIQYQKWWNDAVKETETLLKNNQDATILNFDFKKFFHTASINFAPLSEYINNKDQSANIYNSTLHQILIRTHEKYKELLNEKLPLFLDNHDDNSYPLPIGLLSSHIIANWHLEKFDKEILEQLNPIYYGRYVDDILIVLKDRIISTDELNKYNHTENENTEEVRDEGEINRTQIFFEKYLQKIFQYELSPEQDDSNNANQQEGKTEKVRITLCTGIGHYPFLELQAEKLYIYQFNYRMSPNLLSKFVKEQEKRGYIFQYLSDEVDDMFNEFEVDAFEDSLEDIDINKSKFKQQEINRFRFAVFMAKLIKRRILNGQNYKKEEIEKISKYFKGTYVLKNYHFWEKLFTLYIVSNEKNRFWNLLNTISNEIDKLGFSSDETTEKDNTLLSIKECLKSHLRYSLQMALGLHPDFLIEEQPYELTKKGLKQTLLISILSPETSTNDIRIDDYRNLIVPFRISGLLRSSYVYYPLVQFTKSARANYIPLYKPNYFSLIDNKSDNFNIEDKKFLPYRIKFYDAALFTFYEIIYTKTINLCTNNKRWFQDDVIKSWRHLQDSYNLFHEANGLPYNPDLRKQYFDISYEEPICEYKDSIEEQCGLFYHKKRDKNYLINQIKLINGGNTKDTLRIAMVNKYVDFHNYESSLKGAPIINESRAQIFSQIIDETKKIKECDLFVMPELALPHYFLPTYVSKSAHNQIGCITGIEHIPRHNIGFNFVLTILPINVNGDKDAIPVFRLKNHYSPLEEEWINGLHKVVPKPLPYRYDLFIWRGVYFSTYYCFELADIFHRYALFGKIDLLVAPVWNQDTGFYNNIVETTSRDMHIYVVQVNTSQYGESRIVRPTNTNRRDKARVKGGTVKGHAFTLSVSDIDIKNLRDFQTLTFAAQKGNDEKHLNYKPTPPDYPIEDTKRRIRNESFEWTCPEQDNSEGTTE